MSKTLIIIGSWVLCEHRFLFHTGVLPRVGLLAHMAVVLLKAFLMKRIEKSGDALFFIIKALSSSESYLTQAQCLSESTQCAKHATLQHLIPWVTSGKSHDLSEPRL